MCFTTLRMHMEEQWYHTSLSQHDMQIVGHSGGCLVELMMLVLMIFFW